jgi:hypothetical protein
MSKIYLVMERFFHWTDEYYRVWGDNICGRPEKVFTTREEAESHCNHLNRMVRPVRAHNGGWSGAIVGFCRMEKGEREELPDEAWGSFDASSSNPYRVVEVERDDADVALVFNQQENPTYQQCHEIAHFFGLRSAMESGLDDYRKITPEEQALLDNMDGDENEKLIEIWKPVAQIWELVDLGKMERAEAQEREYDLFRHYPQPEFAWVESERIESSQDYSESYEVYQISNGDDDSSYFWDNIPRCQVDIGDFYLLPYEDLPKTIPLWDDRDPHWLEVEDESK